MEVGRKEAKPILKITIIISKSLKSILGFSNRPMGLT